MQSILFNALLDEIMENTLKTSRGTQWGWFKVLEDLDFADDVCLITLSLNGKQPKLSCLIEAGRGAGI